MRIGGNPCGNDCTGGPCNDAEDSCEGGKVWGPYVDETPPLLPDSPVFNNTTGQLLCGPHPLEIGSFPASLLGPTFTDDNGTYVLDIYYPSNDWTLAGPEISQYDQHVILHADYITSSSGTATISRQQPINLEANTSRYLIYQLYVYGPPCVMYNQDWSITISSPIDYSVTYSGKLTGQVVDPTSCVPETMLTAFLFCKCPFDTPADTPPLGSHYNDNYYGYGNPPFSDFGSFDITWSGISGLGATDAELLIVGPWLGTYSP